MEKIKYVPTSLNEFLNETPKDQLNKKSTINESFKDSGNIDDILFDLGYTKSDIKSQKGSSLKRIICMDDGNEIVLGRESSRDEWEVLDTAQYESCEKTEESEDADFYDTKKGYPRPGLNDEYNLDEEDDSDMNESIKAKKERIDKLLENIREKRKKRLNEQKDLSASTETALQEKEDDDVNLDDLDLGDDTPATDDTETTSADTEETTNDEEIDLDGEVSTEETPVEGETEETTEDEEKVEITEFIITVDDADSAIEELAEKEVTAEKVLDEEGEEVEGQIKVSAENWDALREWLEEHDFDVQEMFGEIETEEVEETPEGEESEESTEAESEETDIEGPSEEDINAELDSEPSEEETTEVGEKE